MPGKSGHSKGKHLSRSKRRKEAQKLQLERQHSPAINIQQQTSAPVDEPAAVPAPTRAVSEPKPTIPTPAASISKPVAKIAVAQHPYIGIELKRIGILAGIMLVILVVLALFLS